MVASEFGVGRLLGRFGHGVVVVPRAQVVDTLSGTAICSKAPGFEKKISYTARCGRFPIPPGICVPATFVLPAAAGAPPDPLATVPLISTATPLTVLLITLVNWITFGTLIVEPFGTFAKFRAKRVPCVAMPADTIPVPPETVVSTKAFPAPGPIESALVGGLPPAAALLFMKPLSVS